MPPKLVFDIGLHNGDDAAYYLHLGYRVIGVEANPVLASQCEQRFGPEIAQGRMTVVSAGVMRQPGEFTFYQSLKEPAWSTFEAGLNRKPGEWREVKVSCITAADLIARFGVPHFIKVDIEGADFQVLETLTPPAAPAYISLEINSRDAFLDRLVELGYDSFKFVDGLTCRPATPILDHQIGWRVVRRISIMVPPFHRAMQSLPDSLRPKAYWNPPGKYSPDGYPFPRLSSGAFGEQAAGRWLNRREAKIWLQKLLSDFTKAGREHALWWDVHARHSTASRLKGISSLEGTKTPPLRPRYRPFKEIPARPLKETPSSLYLQVTRPCKEDASSLKGNINVP